MAFRQFISIHFNCQNSSTKSSTLQFWQYPFWQSTYYLSTVKRSRSIVRPYSFSTQPYSCFIVLTLSYFVKAFFGSLHLEISFGQGVPSRIYGGSVFTSLKC